MNFDTKFGKNVTYANLKSHKEKQGFTVSLEPFGLSPSLIKVKSTSITEHLQANVLAFRPYIKIYGQIKFVFLLMYYALTSPEISSSYSRIK